jgi:S-adenosylmethionine hydrolase
MRRRTPEPRREPDGTIVGEVLTIDRFGNAITNLFVRGDGALRVADRTLPLARTYAEVAVGAPVALVGSNGLLEVAVREGNAAAVLTLAAGAAVRWVPKHRT